jgi:hypothetical protein
VSRPVDDSQSDVDPADVTTTCSRTDVGDQVVEGRGGCAAVVGPERDHDREERGSGFEDRCRGSD